MSNNSENDKIEILMNKINELETNLNSERKTNTDLKSEITDLKNIKIPFLESTLQEKENFIEKILIEQIETQKEFMKNNENSINLFNYGLYKDIHTDKDNLLQNQENKIEYLNRVYKDLQNKYKEKSIENEKEKNELKEKIDTLNNIIENLKNTQEKLEEKIKNQYEEILSLSSSQKNLIIEIESLFNLINSLQIEKERYEIESNYFKKENEFQKKNLDSALSRFKQLDTDYKSINKSLENYKAKLSNIETKTFIFNVTSIGRVIDNSAEIIFKRDGKNNYIVNIKYITYSSKYDILDINSVLLSDKEENVICFKFKDGKIENFRTNEGNTIITVYNNFHKSAIENLDLKKVRKEDRIKQKQIKQNVNDMFSIFDD